jgi:hypothetical protein
MPSADEALAIAGRVLDCELKAANRYDNGRSSIADVAESVVAACYGEIVKMWTAFHVPLSDPNIESDNFRILLE